MRLSRINLALLTGFLISNIGCGGGGGSSQTPPPTVQAPSGLTYATNPANYTMGMLITPNTPSNIGGAVVTYGVSPALPSGLYLNSVTGVVSSLPTAITPMANYVVTASNGGGSTTCNLSIAVNDVIPSALSYPTNPAVYTAGMGIVTNTPNHSGGSVVSWTISPTLPAGLSFSTTSGAISGTPAAPSSSQNYTIKATNSGGFAQITLNISVTPQPLGIAMQPSDQLVLIGNTASFSVAAIGTGSLTYQWMKNSVPISGAITSSYTTPLATLSDYGALYSVAIADSYGGLVTSTGAKMIVIEGQFTPAASMNIARAYHTATILPNGMVLIVGGIFSYTPTITVLASAEIYNPSTNSFTLTGSLTTERYGHTATLLPNGKVLIVGGSTASARLPSMEIYDPNTGEFSSAGPRSSSAWFGHTATLLTNGKVLLVGGSATVPSQKSALFDPLTGNTQSTTGSLPTAIVADGASATLLQDGQVLIAGGGAGAFYYSPLTDSFSSMIMPITQTYLAATLLLDNRVLLTGGMGMAGPTPTAETWNGYVAPSFSLQDQMTSARMKHTAILLQSGKVLVAGGLTTLSLSDVASGADLFNPATNLFTITGPMSIGRYCHTATLLPNGKVMVTGGLNSQSIPMTSAELYQ